MAERNVSIDLLKAFSILGVVYIHSGNLFSPYSLNSAYFRFCVPVFITISFFLAESKTLEAEGPHNIFFVLDRLKRLFIPFAVWSIMYFVIHLTEHGYPGLIKTITMYFSGYGWAGQYYFIILFQLTLLYPLFTTKNVYFKTLIFTGIATLVLYLLAFYLNKNRLIQMISNRLFIYWVYYLLMGIIFARMSRKVRSAHVPSIVLVILLFTIPFLMVWEDVLLKQHGMTVDPYGRFSVLIASTLVFYAGFKTEIENKALKKVFSLLSSYSLGIFCLNPLVMMLLAKTGWRLDTGSPVLLFLMPFLTMIMVVLICLGISFVLAKSKLRVLVK